MKTLILYASSHGTTAKVAKHIAESLPTESVTLINLKNTKKIDLSTYEQVVLGSSIHAGHGQRKMLQFCKKHLTELLQKRVVLFLSCLNPKEFEQSKQNAYPELLRHHATAYQLTGGEYLMEKMNFIERFLVKKMVGVTETKSLLNEKSIANIISVLKNK
jgi:menaquinone-dependent protoporphyrinogen oxidase